MTKQTPASPRKKRRWGLSVAACLMAIGALGFAVSHQAMMATSTPEFCAMCHEIQPAYDSWRTSSHRVNDKGVVAECIDCHLPDPSHFARFFWAKAYHGAKDVYAHLFKGEYDRDAAKRHARAGIPNERCQRCHADLLATGMSRGAMIAHRATLYPKRPGYEKSCTQCHENLVHKPRALYAAR